MILACAGLLRLEVARRAMPLGLIGDEVYYAQVALSLAAGKGHRAPIGQALRPPAFPGLLSLVVDRERPLDEAVVISRFVWLQVALSTLLVGVTFLIGRAWFDARTGIVAALIAALEPGLVAYSHFLWSETLFAPLVLLGLLAVREAQRRPSLVLAALAGGALGAATLTREMGILVAGIAALWGVWVSRATGLRAASARGALLLAVAAAVVLPWTWRNYTVLGRFVPVATVGWYAIAEGNLLSPDDWWDPLPDRALEFRRRYFGIPDEMGRIDFARRRALAAIAEEQPSWLAKKLLRNVSLLFQPDSFLAKKIARGAYGRVSPARVWLVLGATVAAGVAVLLLGLLGVLTAPGRGERLLVAWILGVVVALHVAANATTRFLMPWMPLVIAYAAWVLLHLREARARLRGWRAWSAAIALLFYLGVCLPHFAHHSQTARAWRGERGSDAAAGLE